MNKFLLMFIVDAIPTLTMKMAHAMFQMVAVNEQDVGKRVQAVIVESVPFAQVDGASQVYNLPWDCDELDAVWVEFPEDYKPVHAFGLCSAIESATLHINQRLITQVSSFDLFAFGTPSPHENLVQLPMLPSGKLHLGKHVDAHIKASMQLRLTLSQPLGVKVLVSKRFYDAETRKHDALRAPVPMYQFYNVTSNVNEPGAMVPIGAKSPTLQIAVALVDAVGRLQRAARVSLVVHGVEFELKKSDPRNPNPKGIYTYTFEPFSGIYGPVPIQEVRTTLNLSRLDVPAIRITTEGLPAGCKAHISTIYENVFADSKPSF